LSTEQALGFGAGTVFLFFYDTRGGMTGVHACNATGLVSRSSRPGVTQTEKYGRGEGETVRRQGRIFPPPLTRTIPPPPFLF
ncbi:MAG: hypothetical protein KDE56_17240, partial [Anaerolineales bacterium]|nr:hypothetical protein [Anaerolineales bacterium]